jgi:formylglycine-generating enzyme required for sulfatase activity
MKTQNVYTTFSLSLSLLFASATYAGEGVLALATDPPDADIYIDGQLKVNTTPVIFRLPEGKHQIEIKATGKFPKQLEVLIANDAIISKKVTLTDLVPPPPPFPKPEMVIIPAGQFRMGDIRGTGDDDEQPVRRRSMKSFAMSRHEVTFEEYDYFAEQTGREKPNDKGWGRGKRPVINVSWDDAVAYAEWLSQKTGEKYRLPTEAEWEYAARAGTETDYWWGNEIGVNRANCDGCGSQWDNQQTAPVCSFPANSFGLCDTVGNVWEWTCSGYEEKYSGGKLKCVSQADSRPRVLRGGGWYDKTRELRASFRGRYVREKRNSGVGFRVVRM